MSTWDPTTALRRLASESQIMELAPEEQARAALRDNSAMAAQAIVWLSQNSDNERTRLDASKYIVDRVLGPASMSAPSQDPLEAFLSEVVREADIDERAEALASIAQPSHLSASPDPARAEMSDEEDVDG